MESFKNSVLNTNTTLAPSPLDLLLAVPRLAQRAGSFAFFYLPEQFDNILGKARNTGSIIAERTVSDVINATVATASQEYSQASTVMATATANISQAGTEAAGNIFTFQNVKNIGGIFSYITSKWALATFSIAILLNRTQFYASSRVPLVLRWHLRLAVYLLPIAIFIYQTQSLLQAMRCQTSPSWGSIQYGGDGKAFKIDFAGEGGFLYRLSSGLLFWQDDEGSCHAVNMLPLQPDKPRASGSISLLWPLFLSLGFSQFVETLACAVQGRQPMPETGMTIFEHSLAFSEAEALITGPLGVLGTNGSDYLAVNTPAGASFKIKYAVLRRFMNVPPEVLLISLISSLSHLSSNVLAVIGLRARLRLITTGVWGLAYMTAFIWSFSRAVSSATGESGSGLGVLNFPTVCIVGFIPHLLILIGICACGAIYGLALLLTALSPPPGQPSPASIAGRFSAAYKNLQANIHLSASTPIRINWQEDFYTALLKVGFTILTAASEAVYLNEGTRVTVSERTWLEEDRIQELISKRQLLQRTLGSIPPELMDDTIAQGLGTHYTDDGQLYNIPRSGYSRERKTRKVGNLADASQTLGREHGVGFLQRRSRWTTTFQLIKGIFWLLVALNAQATILVLSKLRISMRPAWLVRLAGNELNTGPKATKETTRNSGGTARPTLNFLVLDNDGHLKLPNDRNVDVEAETKRRLEDAGVLNHSTEQSEEVLDNSLYSWWKNGGWWGDIDNSGDYETQTDIDDDTTSVVSFSTVANEDSEWSDVEGSGRSTPTRENPYGIRSKSSSYHANDILDTSQLARLLDPQTREDKEEARLLARHLERPGIMTRSQYRKMVEKERSRVITSSRFLSRNVVSGTSQADTEEEEEKLLERYILERRSNPSPENRPSGGDSWDTGAEGMGSGGPQCAVCQLSPRTILVWPCGCLSLCDDCRVGLATRNYTSCVCCRTNVVAYSRLYVP